MSLYPGSGNFLLNTCDAMSGSGCVFDSGLKSSLSSLSSALLLSSLSSNYQPVEGFISFVSLQSSYAWYLKLSQFETIFLGLLMLQVSVLRYLEILPININNWFLGEPSGRRRKRRSFWKTSGFNCNQDVIMQSLLQVLTKLDDGSCLARTVCELASSTGTNDIEVPTETASLLEALKASAKYRVKGLVKSSGEDGQIDDYQSQEDKSGISYCAAMDGLKKYEEAVQIGTSANYPNATLCEDRYSSCPLTRADIKEYIGILDAASIL